MDDDKSEQLKIIENRYDEATRQCTEMLLYWLQSHSNATWNDLIEALKTPGVDLHNVASTVENICNG